MYNLFKLLHTKLKNRFKSLSIKWQLILTYIPLFLIPFIIFGIISYNNVSKTLYDNSAAFVKETIKILNHDISKKLDEIEEIGVTIILDPDLHYILFNNIGDLDYYSRFDTVKNKLDSFINTNTEIRTIFVYPQDRPVLNSYVAEPKKDLDYKNSEKYVEMTKDNKSKAWSILPLAGEDPVKDNYLYFQRAIPTNEGACGVLQIQLYENSIQKTYKDVYFGEDATVFVTDSQGVIVSHPDKNMISTMYDSSVLHLINGSEGSLEIKIGNTDFLLVYSTIENNSWKLIATIPMNYIKSESEKIFRQNLALVLAISAFIVAISILISLGITKPLKRIRTAMRSIEKGNFDIRLEADNENEVGKLCRSYNLMASEIKNLMNLIREEEKRKKEAYIHALQAQIKPHFIYNTLFTVKCLASINKQYEIEKMLAAFINLLMASINKEGEFVPISKEIDYIKNYVLIQSYKFESGFELVYNISEEIMDFLILKLLLQPVVENALIHGFEGQVKDCCITIKGLLIDHDIVFSILDNGKGLDSDKINRLLRGEEREYKNVFSGIGIKNVDERIKLFFGSNYGLEFSSNSKGGTEVRVRIPAIRSEEELRKYV